MLTWLNLFYLSPLFLAALGLFLAAYGWVNGDPERIRQGLSFTIPAVGCFLLIGGLLALNGVRAMLVWIRQKFFF